MCETGECFRMGNGTEKFGAFGTSQAACLLEFLHPRHKQGFRDS